MWSERLSWEHDLPGRMWLNSGKSGGEKSAEKTVTFKGMPSKSYVLYKFLLHHTTNYKAGTTGIFYIKLNVQKCSSAWNMSKANFNCVALFDFFFSFKMIGNNLFISIYDNVSNLLDWFCPESQAKCCHALIGITREEPELKVGNTTEHAQWYKE